MQAGVIRARSSEVSTVIENERASGGRDCLVSSKQSTKRVHEARLRHEKGASGRFDLGARLGPALTACIGDTVRGDFRPVAPASTDPARGTVPTRATRSRTSQRRATDKGLADVEQRPQETGRTK